MAENVSTFLALDLDGPVCNLALCDAAAAGGLDAPGWPIRAAILRLQTCIDEDTAGPCPAALASARQKLADAKITAVAVLGAAGRTEPCRLARELGVSSVCVPRQYHAISPRGIVPAGRLMHYSRQLDPSAPPDLRRLRDPFVELMEKAADDVQGIRLEQDDAILDRYVELRHPAMASSLVVPVESLTDAEWFHSSLMQSAHQQWEGIGSVDELTAVAVHLRCAVELPNTFPSKLPATDGRLERAVVPITGESRTCFDRTRLLAGDHGRGPVTLIENSPRVPQCTSGPCYAAAGAVHLDIAEGWAWHVTTMGHVMCRLLS